MCIRITRFCKIQILQTAVCQIIVILHKFYKICCLYCPTICESLANSSKSTMLELLRLGPNVRQYASHSCDGLSTSLHLLPLSNHPLHELLLRPLEIREKRCGIHQDLLRALRQSPSWSAVKPMRFGHDK